jgi:hypothetical protein
VLPDELVALAGTSARALVAAMTTDAWQAARAGFLRLFGRAEDPPQRVEVLLDSNAALVAQAPDPVGLRQNLAGIWQAEIVSLLGSHPEAAGELGGLLAQVRAELPRTLQSFVQTNVARAGGTVFAVQAGNMVVHDADAQAARAAHDDDDAL